MPGAVGEPLAEDAPDAALRGRFHEVLNRLQEPKALVHLSLCPAAAVGEHFLRHNAESGAIAQVGVTTATRLHDILRLA